MSLDSFVTLGHSGLRVSPLCLGAMTFGEDDGRGANNLGALDVTLTDEQITALDAASTPTLGFPAMYAEISATLGFSGTRIDGVQMSRNPALSMSAARY